MKTFYTLALLLIAFIGKAQQTIVFLSAFDNWIARTWNVGLYA